jgi:hypothetical protein
VLAQILKPADKKKFPYGTGAGGIGSNRPVTPPRTNTPAGGTSTPGTGLLGKASSPGANKPANTKK